MCFQNTESILPTVVIKRGCLTSLLFALLLGCFPNIPPVPQPIDVVPIVTPVAGDVFLVVIEETAERTAETAAVLNGSSEWWHKLGARGVSYRWYDDDTAGVEKFASAVKERPGFVLMDSTGKRLKAGPLPKATAELDQILKGVGK